MKLKFQIQFLAAGDILPQFHTTVLKNPPGSPGGISVCIFITPVNHFANSTLYNGLGTFMTGKQRVLNGRTLERTAVIVENGVKFCMTDISILGIQQ